MLLRRWFLFALAGVCLGLVATAVRAQVSPPNLPPPGGYQAIPNFSGPGAGLQFRTAINDRFGGSQAISPKFVGLSFSNLPAEQDGLLVYCADCQETIPCSGGGSGAWAFGQNGQWTCTAPNAPGNVLYSGASNAAGSLGLNRLTGAGTTPSLSTFSVNGRINVKAYGAKGDGTTDDSTAIQKALDAASSGGTVYFPCTGGNSYYIGTSTLTISNPGVTLQGCHGESDDTASANLGTTIESAGTGNTAIKITASGVTVRDLRVKEAAANASNVGIDIDPQSTTGWVGNFSLSNIQVVGGGTAGADAGDGIVLASALKGVLQDVTAINWSVGVLYARSSGNTIDSNADPLFGCKLRQNQYGLQTSSGADPEVMLIGSTVENNMIGIDAEGSMDLRAVSDHFEDVTAAGPATTVSVCGGSYKPSNNTDVVLCGGGFQHFVTSGFYGSVPIYSSSSSTAQATVSDGAVNGTFNWNSSAPISFHDTNSIPSTSGTGMAFYSGYTSSSYETKQLQPAANNIQEISNFAWTQFDNPVHFNTTKKVYGLTLNCAGTATLTSGAATVTNSCITAGSPIVCTDNTSTTGAGCSAVPSSGSLALHGTGSDVVSWAQF